MIKSKIINNAGIIFLARPEKRNALNPTLIKNLKDKLIEFKNNDNIKSIIITGEGNSFCAGADLEYLKSLSSNSTIENYNDSKSLAELFVSIYEYPKPTIAAVNGSAIAGGCGLASVCDFILAHPEKSKFGYSEVKIGFIPAIVSIFLIKKVGEGLAKQLLMDGEIISGQRAYEIGFVNYLVENVLDESISLAEKINKNSVESLRLTKEMINNISNLSVCDAVNYCVGLNTISRSTEDFKNGIDNFLSKDK
ncbi:MAG: enoyl-CoA hydratase/isomerase family protein [Ignavibacteriales bacterium]|nr:enoyl-CoA hydratase/isomerase family protein [Ignavibacteriales bacterium]